MVIVLTPTSNGKHKHPKTSCSATIEKLMGKNWPSGKHGPVNGARELHILQWVRIRPAKGIVSPGSWEFRCGLASRAHSTTTLMDQKVLQSPVEISQIAQTSNLYSDTTFVSTDGTHFAFRLDVAWSEVPLPFKYRPNSSGVKTLAVPLCLPVRGIICDQALMTGIFRCCFWC